MREAPHEMHQSRDTLKTEMLMKAGATLAEIDWRLLQWLLRYPLQRADDLVVGVARWASRATVYRYLQELEASRLVESAVPAMPGSGKRLYHLSNLGLHVLARQMGRSARDLAHQWQADEAGLLRLLPHLPVLQVVQEVVNGLVTGAAGVMTNQGRHPHLVRWTWQRDVIHRFQYREQAMRLFVDGAMALCIRTRQKDDSSLDQWYGLLLLYTDLSDERVMRLRLDRLLCWRESSERWPVYQHMPPVLILAASPRQCEHWQRAVETSALKLRFEPLQGALVCLPGLESGREDLWRFAWHMLSGGYSCHLRDLLKPLPPAALLPTLYIEEGEEAYGMQSHAQTREAPAPAEKIVRLVVGNLARRAITVTRDDPEDREIIALLGLRLTPRHWSVFHLLLAHPLLSVEELAALLNLKSKSVRCSLYELHRLSCLEPVSTEVGRRWHLCRRGLRLLAEANYLHIRNIASKPEDESDTDSSSTVVQRGEAWLLSHIRHTAGIYGFFAGLARAARQQPEQELCWWEM